MTYAISHALQSAVYQVLQDTPDVVTPTAGAIYDALPSGTVPPLFVQLGQEIVRDKSDASGRGAEHEFMVSVVSSVTGFAAAKSIAGAVSDALVQTDLTLTRGRVIFLNFLHAKAIRTADGRRIDLTFLARVEDN